MSQSESLDRAALAGASELSCLGAMFCLPVSWRRFWAIYGPRTSGTKWLPLPCHAPAAHPLPAHRCAHPSHVPHLSSCHPLPSFPPKPPKHFATRAVQGKLCVPAPLWITAISPGMSYPRERGKYWGGCLQFSSVVCKELLD